MGKFAILEDPKGRAVCSADLLRPQLAVAIGSTQEGGENCP